MACLASQTCGGQDIIIPRHAPSQYKMILENTCVKLAQTQRAHGCEWALGCLHELRAESMMFAIFPSMCLGKVQQIDTVSNLKGLPTCGIKVRMYHKAW
jgi:hypothetical protein